MASSYSAIKIPVPGNLIDTPNAEQGHLLRFNNGVYSNFKPLIIDITPDSGARSLTFNVSIGTAGSYDATTETGMFLSKNSNSSGINDFSLNINGGRFAATSTLGVNGDVSIGQTNQYIFPDGATRPEFESKFIPLLKSDGNIEFDFLSSIAKTPDNTINVSGNDISVNRDVLAFNLYTAGDGINLTGQSDSVTGGVIEADLEYLRANNNPELTSSGLFHATGGVGISGGHISLDGSDLKAAGVFDSGYSITFEQKTTQMTISVDPTVLGKDGELFTFRNGIALSIEAGKEDRFLDTPFAHGGNSNDPDEDGAVYLATGGSQIASHLRFEGFGDFRAITGGWDATGSVTGGRHYVMSLSSLNMTTHDGGGLEILTKDFNNDEFAIKHENLTGAGEASSDHLISCGHDSSRVPLDASNHPLFYIKATTGIVYNSSNIYSEGRLLLAKEDSMTTGGFGNKGLALRSGENDLPNVPAHISVIDDTPSLLLDQTKGINGVAPHIIMTSADPENMAAFGPKGGTENAATIISNRDGEILSIESTTRHMTSAVYDPTSTSTSSNRNNATDSQRVHVWSMEYYDSSSNGADYYYMRMGANGVTGTSPGTNYLPTSSDGDPPAGMRVGGIYIDTSNGNILKMKMA